MKRKNADGVGDYDDYFTPYQLQAVFRPSSDWPHLVTTWHVTDHVDISQAFTQGELLPDDGQWQCVLICPTWLWGRSSHRVSPCKTLIRNAISSSWQHAWYTTMNAFLQREGYKTVGFEKSMRKVTIDGHHVLLCAHIDDFVLACTIDRSSTLFANVCTRHLISPMKVHSNTKLDAKLPETWSQVLHNFLKLSTSKKFGVLLDSGLTFHVSSQ